MDRFHIEKHHLFGIGGLAIGIFISTGFYVSGATLSKKTYVASTPSVIVERDSLPPGQASALKSIELKDDAPTSTEEDTLTAETEIEEEEIVFDESVAEGAAEQTSTQFSSENLAALQAQAEALIEEVSAQQESASAPEDPGYFVTPNGVKIDANGNIVTGDEPVETAQSNVAATEQTQDLPPGVYRLPSGVLVDASGNIVSSTGVNTQSSIPSGYFRTPSGALVDSNGNVIEDPDGNKPGEDNTTEVTYSTSSPPAVGSTINIPRSVTSAVDWNTTKACNELGMFNQRLVLCELYKHHEEDYTWVKFDA